VTGPVVTGPGVTGPGVTEAMTTSVMDEGAGRTYTGTRGRSLE